MAQPRDWHGRFASKSGTNKAKGDSGDRKGKEARKTRRKKKTAEEKRAAKASRLQKRLVFEAKVRRFNTTVRTVEGTVRTGTRLHGYAKDFSTVDWSGGLESKKARERSQQQIKEYRQRTIDRNKREAFARKKERERVAEVKRQQRERDRAKKEAREKTTGDLLSRQYRTPLPSGVKKPPATTTRSMAEANRDFAASKAKKGKKPVTKKQKAAQKKKTVKKSRQEHTVVTTRKTKSERVARRAPKRPSPNSAKARGRSKRNIRRFRESGGTWSPNDLIG